MPSTGFDQNIVQFFTCEILLFMLELLCCNCATRDDLPELSKAALAVLPACIPAPLLPPFSLWNQTLNKQLPQRHKKTNTNNTVFIRSFDFMTACSTGCFFYFGMFDMLIIWSIFEQKSCFWTFFISTFHSYFVKKNLVKKF